MISKGNNPGVIHFLVFAGLSILLVQAAAANEIIQDFENISAIEVKGSKLTAITQGPGVTQGKQAAEMPAGTTIKLSLNHRKFRNVDWLKIDTLNTQPRPVCLSLVLKGKKYNFSRTVYIKSGNDTLALPLTICWGRDGVPNELKLELVNRAEVGVIVDNLRIEKAVQPPEGARLKDYGDGDKNIWPGFENRRSGLNFDAGKTRLREFTCGTPGPFTGDFIGLNFGNTSSYKFYVKTPNDSDLIAWLWITHYGRDRTLAPRYALKTGREYLVRANLSGRQAASASSLTFGKDFDWAPKNFESQYVSRLVDVVKVKFSPGQVFDVKGCQIAAAVYGPAKKETKLTDYVNMVREDLKRYRRQFVLGASGETFCTVVPTEEESKAGIMAFQPPLKEIYSATWAGDEEFRASEIHAVVANGAMANVAIIAVPLKKTKNMQAQLSHLRTQEGKLLPGGRNTSNVVFIERVPRVRSARVVFQPWVIAATHGPADPCQVVWMTVRFTPPDNTKSGLYRGTLKLTCTAGEISLPVALKVVSIGRVPKRLVTVGSTSSGTPEGLYGSVYDGLSASKRDMLTAKIRGKLIAGGLTGLMVPGVSLDKKLKLDDSACLRHLKMYPSRRKSRQIVFTLAGALWRLRDKKIDSDENEYKELMKSVVGRTYDLAAKAGAKRPLLYIGRCWKIEAIEDLAEVALTVAAAKGRAAITVQASVLDGIGEARLRRLFKPFSGVFVSPNRIGVHETIAILKDIGCEVYTYLGANDRYHVGFYSFGIGVDGVYLENLFSRCSPYDGFRLRGKGLLAPHSGGAISPTLAMLRVQQGVSDFRLARNAQELVRKAERAKLPSVGVKSVLDDISKQAQGIKWLNFDESKFRTTSVSESDIESHRIRLIEATGALAEKLKSK